MPEVLLIPVISFLMWRKFVQDYLSFTRGERRGILVLCILIILCWCVPVVLKYFQKDTPQDLSSFQREVALFEHQQDSLQQVQRHVREIKNVLNADQLPQPFPFDPNTLSGEGWRKLGMPLHLIRTIQHYLEAGGRFYKKEDLKKIYGLSPEIYQHLASYIRIAAKKPRTSERDQTPTDTLWHHPAAGPGFMRHTYAKKKIILDINKADSAAWVKLRGIGPVLSSRVIRFRKALGGFHSMHQVAEVYGLPDSTFQAIKQQLKISPFTLKKLNINTATVEELKSHPYISYRLAVSIKAFRDQHGRYDSIEDLKQLQLVDDQIYRKLAPYLTVK